MFKAKHHDNKVYEERIKYLQLYLDQMLKENATFKQKMEDMKMTAMHNKNI